MEQIKNEHLHVLVWARVGSSLTLGQINNFNLHNHIRQDMKITYDFLKSVNKSHAERNECSEKGRTEMKMLGCMPEK